MIIFDRDGISDSTTTVYGEGLYALPQPVLDFQQTQSVLEKQEQPELINKNIIDIIKKSVKD